MKSRDIIDEFQEKYPTREDKENALKKMSNEEIDVLIEAMPNIYGKIFYSSFKKRNSEDFQKKN